MYVSLKCSANLISLSLNVNAHAGLYVEHFVWHSLAPAHCGKNDEKHVAVHGVVQIHPANSNILRTLVQLMSMAVRW